MSLEEVPEPPKDMFVLMWKDPWRVAITHDIGDWGNRNDPPTYWIRYSLSDYGTVNPSGGLPESEMGGEEPTDG